MHLKCLACLTASMVVAGGPTSSDSPLAFPSFYKLIHSVAEARRPDDIYEASLDCLRDTLGVERSSILLLDDEGIMRFRAWRGLSDEYRAAVDGHSPWNRDTIDPQPVLIEDVDADGSLGDLAAVIKTEGINALAFIPLAIAGRLLGKFMLYYSEPHAFSPEEVEIAQAIAANVAFAIDQHLAQESIRERERRYRDLVDALGLAVYTTDAEGRILLYNEAAAELWGRRPEIGQDLWCGSWRIFSPDGEPVALDQCPMAVALKEGRPVRDQEILVERPDGSRASVLPYPTPLWDDTGRLAGAVNVLVDITQRKSAEEKLAQAFILKDQFLSLVSHELRSPISTILGNALLLAKRSDMIQEADKQRAYGDIVSQTRKLHDSIENLLLLTRLESASIEFDALSLPHIAQSAAEVFHDFYPDRTVSFHFDKVPPVLGQETLVVLVVQNLLANAAKYSPPETEIEVLIGMSPDGLAEVRVRDHGIGLDDDDMANLFTPFYRSQRAKDYASGMGLGLAVCRRIIEVQNGSIAAVARPEGGCDFYFTLPEATE